MVFPLRVKNKSPYFILALGEFKLLLQVWTGVRGWCDCVQSRQPWSVLSQETTANSLPTLWARCFWRILKVDLLSLPVSCSWWNSALSSAKSESFNTYQKPLWYEEQRRASGRGLVTQRKPRAVMPENDHNNVYVTQTADWMTRTSVTAFSWSNDALQSFSCK